MLDGDGNQLWTWNKHRIYRASNYRASGFCLSSDGHVGHVGGNAEPLSVGVISPNGTTLWQAVNSNVLSGIGLVNPAFDSDLNLYAVGLRESYYSGVLVSYSPTGVLRWTVNIEGFPLHWGAYCSGDIIYVSTQGAASAESIICSFDQDGNKLGERRYGGATGIPPQMSHGAIGLNLDGNAVVMRYGEEHYGDGVGFTEILDEVCDVADTRSLTFSPPVATPVGLYTDNIFGIGLLSSGKIVCAGQQGFVIHERDVVYDLDIDERIFYSLPYSTGGEYGAVDSHQGMNTVFDGDGRIYCVDLQIYSPPGYFEGIAVTGLNVLAFTESGSAEFTVTETSPIGDFPGNSFYNSVQVDTIPGRLLIGSSHQRLIKGFGVS